MPFPALITECEVRNTEMKRTISGMIGAGSLAHNRRSFLAENVDPNRVGLNIKYCDENLKDIYHELFDEAVERYNVGKRNDRKITDYYDKIQHGKQEKLFHEVIFQIGNSKDMAVESTEGELAVKVLDEYMKDFQKRNPTLRIFNCYLHLDEATPHLHIDFVPYVTNWKGKGMDTRVSLKQALKSLGFQGGSKHDSELNQWINHEKEVLAKLMEQRGIEWEQKGTHEEHLDVYNFKKKERAKEVQALEKEKGFLIAENEGLTARIEESKVDIEVLEQEKKQAEKGKEQAEKELKYIEERREQLQPIMDKVDNELKNFGKIDLLLPEAGALERASTYRDKRIKPLFIKMKNSVAALVAKVLEVNEELEKWKVKYQRLKIDYNVLQKDMDETMKCCNQLSEDKEQLQIVSERYDRVVRVLGISTVDAAIQKDIQIEQELEDKRRRERMQKGIHDRLQWGKERSDEYNLQRKKSKTKHRGMER